MSPHAHEHECYFPKKKKWATIFQILCEIQEGSESAISWGFN